MMTNNNEGDTTMTDDMMIYPKPDDVDMVLVCADVEVWTDPDDEARSRNDRATRDDYLARAGNGGGLRTELSSEPETSEHGVEEWCWHGKVVAELTVEQWRKVCDDLCIDVDDDSLLPDRGVEDTMGILCDYGVVPAVAIMGTDEGWDADVIASFYVAFLTKGEK